MSANTWYIISLVGYFSAFVGLVITIVIYIRLNILDVIGDLTGKTVAKELKSMREKRNAKPGSYKDIRKSPGKSSGSQGGKSSRQAARTIGRKTAKKTSGRTGEMTAPQNVAFSRRRAKNGTAEMGNAFAYAQADKQVLHSKTDKLSHETEKLYEDFDPRVEYSRTDILEETADTAASAAPAPKRGTDVLVESDQVSRNANGSAAPRKATEVLVEHGTAVLPGKRTEVLKPGTMLLDENAPGGTALLCEEAAVEPVKFSVTRSYLIVHSEEKIP